jgi:hypothetical protein
MKKRIIYERPVSDYLPDEFKKSSKEASRRLYDDPTNPAPSSNQVGMLMMGLPRMESGKNQQLVNIAIETFYKMYPRIKNLVDKGKIRMDVQLGGAGGRMKTQTPNQEEIKTARETDVDFDERVKQRHFINAKTQGKAWLDGFGAIKKMKDKIDAIDPNLYKNYDGFVRGASRFYWENTEMLERMAASGGGRVAYCDVYQDKNNTGVWVIEVRAPHLPLLMHELVKGAEYYDSLFSLPQQKKVGDALMGITDVHKHEIQNMNYGRSLWSKIRYILEEMVDGYHPNMENDLTFELEGLGPKVYNRFMDGIVNDDNRIINEFIKKCEEIVKTL